MSNLWCSGWITLAGKARPQGSKRVITNKKTGKPMLLDASPESRPWRNDLSLLMQQHAPEKPLRAPVRVEFIVYVPRPKSHLDSAGELRVDAPEHPATGIDLDKIARAVGDAGTGIWWADDDQICQWKPERRYTGLFPERIEVWARALSPEPEQLAAERAQARQNAAIARQEAREAAARLKEQERAIDLALRTLHASAMGWAVWLEEHSGKEYAAARRRVGKVLQEWRGGEVIPVTFTPGEWERLRRGAAGEESK